MTAKEFLKRVSPNDNYGIREKLQSQNMRRIVEGLMEHYAKEYARTKLQEAAEKMKQGIRVENKLQQEFGDRGSYPEYKGGWKRASTAAKCIIDEIVEESITNTPLD